MAQLYSAPYVLPRIRTNTNTNANGGATVGDLRNLPNGIVSSPIVWPARTQSSTLNHLSSLLPTLHMLEFL